MGNTARASAMWPFSTSVNVRRSCAVGVPRWMVRVTSVVPSLENKSDEFMCTLYNNEEGVVKIITSQIYKYAWI
jgi:hypothetical protein